VRRKREYAFELLRYQTDFIDYTVDRNVYKQGKFLPGTHIPIYHPDMIKETKPIMFLSYHGTLRMRSWSSSVLSGNGGKIRCPIPEVRVYD